MFGSSRPQPNTVEYAQAYELGREIGRMGFTLCNGGYGGTMEAAAKGARETGARTIGVICSAFGPPRANPWITETIDVDTMVDRMMKLIAMGHAYVVLKGGTGTLLELAAVWEFMNKGLIEQKPIVVVGSFWDPVVHTLRDELAWEGLDVATRFVSIVQTPVECARLIHTRLGEITHEKSRTRPPASSH